MAQTAITRQYPGSRQAGSPPLTAGKEPKKALRIAGMRVIIKGNHARTAPKAKGLLFPI
jgi:hypothetical protein